MKNSEKQTKSGQEKQTTKKTKINNLKKNTQNKT